MILALIITHNRLNELKTCIQKIKSQSLLPDKILVIDNQSNDGTKEYLNNNKIDNIYSINNGSAGGWNLGINYCLKNNYDFIWMMDDDGYPDKFALENLYNNFSKNFSCLSSLILDINDNNKLAIPLPILNKKNNPVIFRFKRKIKYKNYFSDKIKYYSFANFFNGSLININSIKKIGNIDINYFIYGEEVDFFHRLRKVGKVLTCLNSIHYHPSINKRWTRIKMYYYIKNSIHLNFKYYDHPYIRSLLNIFVIFYRIFRYNGLMFFLKTFEYKNIKKLLSAIYKGFKSQIGNDYFQ